MDTWLRTGIEFVKVGIGKTILNVNSIQNRPNKKIVADVRAGFYVEVVLPAK
jgi:hypothetical protein